MRIAGLFCLLQKAEREAEEAEQAKTTLTSEGLDSALKRQAVPTGCDCWDNGQTQNVCYTRPCNPYGCCVGCVLGPDRRDPTTASNYCPTTPGSKLGNPYLKPFYYCGCAPKIVVNSCFQEVTPRYQCTCKPCPCQNKTVCLEACSCQSALPHCRPERCGINCSNHGWCACGDLCKSRQCGGAHLSLRSSGLGVGSGCLGPCNRFI